MNLDVGLLSDEQLETANQIFGSNPKIFTEPQPDTKGEMKAKHKRAYMECAEAFARCSSSTRLSVGAVIVKNNRIISCGYNALPEFLHGSLEDDNGVTRPEVRHAEVNALKGLTKSNETSNGSILFVTHSCCKFCAIDIIDAGIKTVYYQEQYRDSTGLDYLRENGVEVIQYTKE